MFEAILGSMRPCLKKQNELKVPPPHLLVGAETFAVLVSSHFSSFLFLLGTVPHYAAQPIQELAILLPQAP